LGRLTPAQDEEEAGTEGANKRGAAAETEQSEQDQFGAAEARLAGD
jgi:hypothetical protein